MAVDPMEILAEVNPASVPLSSPPDISNYRDADMQGIACAFCSKFSFTGLKPDPENEAGIPVGFCHQWEATVDGAKVCDRFASGLPTFDETGTEQWDFAEGATSFAEIHLSGTDQKEDSGFVIKEVLRTGEWPVIPTGGGQIKKPLRIVRDGASNYAEGTISLSEVVENFRAGAIPNPQIPLSDDTNDHKNTTRLNTGFVRDLWIQDSESGSKLVAKMEFTEPEVKDKVLRGTYADVSCGIPWKIRSRGQEFGSTLEHVCITNRPFIDGLGPFMRASDTNTEEADVNHFGEVEEEKEQGDEKIPGQADPLPSPENEPEENSEEPKAEMSFQDRLISMDEFLVNDLNLSRGYEAFDILGDKAKIRNNIAGTTWVVPFTEDEGKVTLAAIGEWVIEDQGTAEEDRRPAATSGSRQLDELEKARALREIRLSQPSTTRGKEENMPLTREELDALELSDEQRAEIRSLLDENASLRATSRESEADRRVDELKGLGLEERPGFLTFYREVMLSDDGGPAVVLLSDSGQEKSRLTALEILDKAVEALKGADGKVVLSDQALVSGNDNPPPADAEGEKAPVTDRVKAAREALYGKKEGGAE